ncbi:MAG: hypothetical protein R3C09_28520 [Pirellulaceae bacterium]
MPLQFDSSSVVVRGKFNPYIFSPEWLSEQKIWKHKQVQLALGVVGDGVNFRSADGEVSWRVDPFGLTVEAIEADELVLRVLERLPHTPVSAVGFNFVFSQEKWEGVVPKLGGLALDDLPAKFNPELSIWTGVFHVESTRIQMAIATGEEGITVNFNFHEHTPSTSQAKAAVKRFGENRIQCTMMIHEILQETA